MICYFHLLCQLSSERKMQIPIVKKILRQKMLQYLEKQSLGYIHKYQDKDIQKS